MLTSDEITAIHDRWHEDLPRYEFASFYFQTECQTYKASHPRTVRLVFSRDPLVKTVKSIRAKIENRREKKPTYSYDDLTDLIALTVLCPYPSDVEQFILWLKTSFAILTPETEAHRNDPNGHSGFHYVVTCRPDTQRVHPEMRGLKCEIQIKTILQEAFDAKTHDLTYKPGQYEVSTELLNQFRLLSTLMATIDQQSEFLKTTILRKEAQLSLRREACLVAYFKQPDTET